MPHCTTPGTTGRPGENQNPSSRNRKTLQTTRPIDAFARFDRFPTPQCGAAAVPASGPVQKWTLDESTSPIEPTPIPGSLGWSRQSGVRPTDTHPQAHASLHNFLSQRSRRSRCRRKGEDHLYIQVGLPWGKDNQHQARVSSHTGHSIRLTAQMGDGGRTRIQVVDW